MRAGPGGLSLLREGKSFPNVWQSLGTGGALSEDVLEGGGSIMAPGVTTVVCMRRM